MVNFQVMSDVHLEIYKNSVSTDYLIECKEDNLILAGDICHINFGDRLEKFLLELCPKFKKVYYVMGNHEFYSSEGHPTLSIQEVYDKFFEIKQKIDNLVLLDKKCEIIDDVCIIGCTLWSYAEFVPKFIVKIKDMNAVLYRNMHLSDLKFVYDRIEYCKRNKLKLLVVTHYPPTLHALSKHKKKKDKYSSLYATDLEYLLDKNSVHTWIFGHVHKNFDFVTENGTRVVSNQYGKPSDMIDDYSKNKTISI